MSTLSTMIFRAFTNDSCPDWYFEQMVVMRYTARVGFVGYTPKDVKSMASTGRSLAIYNGLVYDVTTYLANPPAIMTSAGTQAPSDIEVATSWIYSSFMVERTSRNVSTRLELTEMFLAGRKLA